MNEEEALTVAEPTVRGADEFKFLPLINPVPFLILDSGSGTVSILDSGLSDLAMLEVLEVSQIFVDLRASKVLF